MPKVNQDAPTSAIDLRKFYVLTKESKIFEYSYGEEYRNIFDLSGRGQLCLVRKNKQSACTVNLLDSAINFEAIDQASTESIGAAPQREEVDEVDERAIVKYTVEEQAAKSREVMDISRLMLLRLQAKYQVDKIGHNAQLSARYMHC